MNQDNLSVRGHSLEPANVTDEALLFFYDKTTKQLAVTLELAQHLKHEIIRRTGLRKATAIPSTIYICEVKTGRTYDQASFTPLKELLLEADLKQCYTPAYEETVQVKEKWYVQQVKKVANQYGNEALKIVEQAARPTSPTVKFAKKTVKLINRRKDGKEHSNHR